MNLCFAFVFPAFVFSQTTQPIPNRYSTLPISGGGRIVIDAPDYISGRRPIRLILYALPNGNTIEWTAGATTRPGEDWHYNIQNIAAQVALLRVNDSAHDYIVAYLESPKKSWPAWSAENGDAAPQRARAIVASVESIFALPGRTIELSLVAHSGGGSFLTRNLLDDQHPWPTELKRVAYIDAYYGSDNETRFAARVQSWLSGDATRQFILCCYDDRNITINGKKVVSDAGGSFRAAHRLLADLTSVPEPTTRTSVEPPIEYRDFLSDQVHFISHANPQNAILHTRLVEWDGLLRAMAIGDSKLPQVWRPLREARSYDAYQPAAPLHFPTTQSATTRAVAGSDAELPLPQRPSDCLQGTAIMTRLAALQPLDQQDLIRTEILRGNVPPATRRWRTVHVEADDSAGTHHVAELLASADYLAIGSERDAVRVPMLPATAQAIADGLHSTLPTRKIVDAIYEAADIQLDPQPMTDQREAISTFVAHNTLVDRQLHDWLAQNSDRPAIDFPLIAGTFKDIVITPRLASSSHKVAIYGWHTRDARPIQPLTTVHKDSYVDYSHGVRLIANDLMVDGRPRTFAAVLRDPMLCVLLSDEGPFEMPRYAPPAMP